MFVQWVVAQQLQGQRLACADVRFGEVGESGGYEQVENRSDAGEGGDFGNQLALVAEHAGARQLFGPFQRIAHFGRAHAEQVFALEAAVEQIGMVQHKGLRHIVDGAADGHAAQHGATLAGRLVSDADMCDAIGAVGIERALVYACHHGGRIFDPKVWPNVNLAAHEYNADGNTHDTDGFINHFFEKLLKLKGLMLTEPGRIEAESRQQIMVDFLRHYFREKNALEWSEFLEKYLLKIVNVNDLQ